jgi:antitoxin component YwqK of YwqJK toxin-antitoxin module
MTKDNEHQYEISYYPNGKISLEKYYDKNGEYHRDGDLPAYISYFLDGGIDYTHFYKNGKLHRDGDKPSSVSYYQDGRTHHRYYHKNGKFHRDSEEPAVFYYHKNQQILLVDEYRIMDNFQSH